MILIKRKPRTALPRDPAPALHFGGIYGGQGFRMVLLPIVFCIVSRSFAFSCSGLGAKGHRAGWCADGCESEFLKVGREIAKASYARMLKK